MRKIPARFQEFAMKYPRVVTAYEALAGECRGSGPLSARDQALVKLGTAAGLRMEGAVHSQVRKALDIGITPDEIRQAVMLGITSLGFPGMMAVLTWAEDILKGEDGGK